MAKVRATSFRVEWDDGSIWTAEGDVAAAVMDWYAGCETMTCVHGAAYRGPQITITKSQEAK